MKICENCKKQFLPVTYYEGKRLWRRGRRVCFECVPYKPSKKGPCFTRTRNTVDGKRQCRICEEFKDFSEFSPTNKFGALNSYCKNCAAQKKKYPKQRFKQECIDYKGGQCSVCGYDKCPAALEFHHRDPEQKDFSIRDIHTVLLTEDIKLELDKCDLLCSNCHKEIHYSEQKEITWLKTKIQQKRCKTISKTVPPL